MEIVWTLGERRCYQQVSARFTKCVCKSHVSHVHGKGMQSNCPETRNNTESLAWCVSVRHGRSQSPGNQDTGFLSRFHRFGLYLKQEFPEEALSWGCPKWPAWWHQHRLLMRQESLQAQVQVLFCSGHFSPVFHNQTKSILKSVLQWCKPPLPHHC